MHVYEPSQFERKWLQVAASTRGIEHVKPLWITIHNWSKLPTKAELPNPDFQTRYLPIAIMAFDTQDTVFKLESVIAQQSLLSSGYAVLIDQKTQRDYGPLDGRYFTNEDLGRETEIGGQKFSIGGLFDLGTGLAANGAVITSAAGFSRVMPWDVNRHVSIGLIDLEAGVSVEQVVADLTARLQVGGKGKDSMAVDVLSYDEMLKLERKRWLEQTPIGLIFQLGVVLSLLVGAAIVYMVLATDVTNRLPEYATLMAMGYSRKYLASIVMTQAITLCLCGFVVAWGAAIVLYLLTYYASGIPIAMNNQRVVNVLALGLLMSCVSGLLALRKRWKAEPASLF